MTLWLLIGIGNFGLRNAGIPLFLLLRLAQLARPLAFVTLLRIADIDSASYFTKLISIFVIMVEVFNLFFPTDRLYLSQSKKIDLYYIIARRVKMAAIMMPVAFMICVFLAEISLVEAVVVTSILLVAAISSAMLAYCYSRSGMAQLFQSEIASITIFVISFVLFMNESTRVFGFSVYALEQSARSIFLGIHLGLFPIRTLKLSLSIKFKRIHSFSNIHEGMAVTVSNQIFRLPFAFLHGIDPIYFVAAQMPPAVYNILIAMNNSSRYRPGIVATLASMAGGGAMLAAIAAFLPAATHAPANLIVLAGFALLHGAQMVAVPGRSGIAADVVARWVVIGGMIAVAVAGLTVHIGFFLATPLVLVSGAEVFAFRRHRLPV